MQEYITPNLQIITLETEDIITTSSSGCSGGAGAPFDRWCVSGTVAEDFDVCYGADVECNGWGDVEVD